MDSVDLGDRLLPVTLARTNRNHHVEEGGNGGGGVAEVHASGHVQNNVKAVHNWRDDLRSLHANYISRALSGRRYVSGPEWLNYSC